MRVSESIAKDTLTANQGRQAVFKTNYTDNEYHLGTVSHGHKGPLITCEKTGEYVWYYDITWLFVLPPG